MRNETTGAGVFFDAASGASSFSFVDTCASPVFTAASRSLPWMLRFSYHQSASSDSVAKVGTVRFGRFFVCCRERLRATGRAGLSSTGIGCGAWGFCHCYPGSGSSDREFGKQIISGVTSSGRSRRSVACWV